MIVRRFDAAPPPRLAAGLQRFERQFRYPLGPGRSFEISHGDDYPRFFRAIGDGISVVAERNGDVIGVIGAARRRLVKPGGDLVDAIYIGDMKIEPAARGGRTLIRLVESLREWLGGVSEAAYAVVMDGTPVNPVQYTGRLGIPTFFELGKISVLRLTAPDRSEDTPADRWITTEDAAMRTYERLATGRYASHGGNTKERSELEPLWLMEPRGKACGKLEDTRRAKRLIDCDGVEMRSAHLSCLGYEGVPAAVELLRVALNAASNLGFPALFVAVAAPESDRLVDALKGVDVVVAPATVFGMGLEPWPFWSINTAEI